MLTIYTSNESRGLADIRADYEFPENGIAPFEQLAWIDAHIEEFKEKDVVVKTFSPYILNYMNLLLASKTLTFETLNAYEMWCSEEDEFKLFEKIDLKIIDKERELIDATSLSDPISYIYSEYNKLRPDPDTRNEPSHIQ